MPRLTRWFIRTSLIYLIAALGVGLLLALGPFLSLGPLGALFPVYIHLLVLGWLTQLIFGVVFWMFPKYSQERPRGSETLGWWTYALLNLGLVLRAFGEPLSAAQPKGSGGWMLVLSAALQLAAVLCFAINTWGRVKER
jgi:hypothetical protein